LIDIAIVSGTDSPLGKVASYGFAKTKVLPLNQSLNEGAVAFQSSSKGFAMSEGAGVLVLEREESAIIRGANIFRRERWGISLFGRPNWRSNVTGFKSRYQ
jgi:3-oxoacyl-[acyl-carrier-protein] synthase II